MITTKIIVPTGWRRLCLADVCLDSGEYGANAPAAKFDENLPRYIRITDIDSDGNLLPTSKKSININKSSRYILEDLDILFARSGATVGKTYLYKINEGVCAYAGYLIRFRCDRKKASPLFLSNFTHSKQYGDWVLSMIRAGAQPNINAKEYASLSILLPSLLEQQKIVNVLGKWNTYFEYLNKVIKCKKAIKKSLMRKLLEGKIRVPGFGNKWETKPLSFYVDLELRPISKPETKFKALGIRSHCKGTFQKLDFDPSKIAMDTLYEVKADDLIVNITFAWEGAIAIVKKDDEGGLVSHRFPTYTFKKHIGNVNFFKQFIQSKRFRHLLKLISPGGAGRNRVLSKKDFLKLKIQIPDYEEQTAIANILTAADRDIEALEKKKSLIEQQKKFLLNNLITGRIRLPEFIH